MWDTYVMLFLPFVCMLFVAFFLNQHMLKHGHNCGRLHQRRGEAAITAHGTPVLLHADFKNMIHNIAMADGTDSRRT